ncbi:alkaline phosphatase [Anditalea andensis]|uniref:Alkaline phosphatase n=1 Tax=Anditalea andensis TaxID=1048983 RepID=A0A074KPW5_9BACT|nr:alkaline phosphatase [Anditalea andensis]KEO71996.1 alkaline phosphatase [Anditalea andensis]
MQLPKNLILISILYCFFLPVQNTTRAQQSFKIHSHNDYLNTVPFWTAFGSQAASIEVDLFLRNDSLLVAHEVETIHPARTFQSLYLENIRKSVQLELEHKPYLLLVDLKTEAEPTLNRLMEICEGYLDILYSPSNQNGIKLVISGKRPYSDRYKNYPAYLFFDHQELTDLALLDVDKVEMISLPFDKFSVWNGKGRIVEEERQALKAVIDAVHQIGKPIRFWATPDSKTAWKALHELGVDYINTDHPSEANKYLGNLADRLVIGQLKSDIYEPHFMYDGKQAKVDKVILLIGDGTGLAQLNAGMVGNGNQLNILNLKNIGLVKTQALDDFTTDSAAGGTAIATGKKTHNRGIGQNDTVPYNNITAALSALSFYNGLVSSDNITGATPAAFFAHQKDRDNINGIGLDLSLSAINVFIAGGRNDFLRYQNGAYDSLVSNGFEIISTLADIQNSEYLKVGYFASHHGLPSVLKGREGYLAQATFQALEFLRKKEGPFFLMVEGAQIDTGGHQNDAKKVVEEVIDFDQAVGVALEFADKNPGTLVLITADHETGGLTLPQGDVSKNLVELEFSTEDHTGIMVPIFAYGPHADSFKGVYENTEIYGKIMEIILKYHLKTDR